MKNLIYLIALCLLISTTAHSQSLSTKFSQPLSSVIHQVESQFGVRLKCSDVDTTGLNLPYAAFRIRPYSLNETLQNILAPFDFKAVKQNDKLYKVKPYEYTRRTPADGEKLTAYLSTLYSDKSSWEARATQLRADVRRLLEIDNLLSRLSPLKPQTTKPRNYDGYSVYNFRIPTIDGHFVYGSVYSPSDKSLKKKQLPLIVCPNGHFLNGRYGTVQQQRLATLARMGAVCISYDLWGWGESEREVGAAAHRSDTAHVMQALNGLRILDWALSWKNIDKSRVAVNGGSGGGTQTVLLSVLDPRITAACAVVSVSSWFDGGCPCESGKPIQLAAGGTCNAELAALMAPRPLGLVSDDGDWTSSTPDVEFPFIRRIYGFYDATDNVSDVHLPGERHDFGPNKRQAVYDFFSRVFSLDKSKVDESRVTIEKENQLTFNPVK
ncbi:MAG: hypothetical protein II951_00080 [Bacteroidales bacterium]|nr:hypothetical protein [Bacteroidales bacterium]